MPTPTPLPQAARDARGLAIDAISACHSGHLGLPLGCAEIGAALFGSVLNYNPRAPKWINRDRFILSAGHGSMFLYSWLHLAGYNVSLQDIKDFRKKGSKTPGHPEFGETEGVEATTGPLGQGIANGVGYALSAKRAQALFNTPTTTLLDYHTIVLAGDGCLQEGIAREAIAFAGHNGLDNLILIYDQNAVTLDALANRTQSEDTEAFFTSQGWDCLPVDGHNIEAVISALQHAKNDDNQRPKVLIASTEIARGIPEVAGTSKGHGEAGVAFGKEARKAMGLPEETFFVSQEVRDFFTQRQDACVAHFDNWQRLFDDWSEKNPDLAKSLHNHLSHAIPANLNDYITPFDADFSDATRAAGGKVIQEVSAAIPSLITGSADLYGSTKNYINGGGDFGKENGAGRNIWFGIREHAMAGISNGIAYDGFFRPSCATFAVFADYLRPSIRVAALAKLPVTYILTHDSVGVGEDGPTHQPVETVSGLRTIPNLDVIRPADCEETAGAWIGAMQRGGGPTALILTRQKVPNYIHLSPKKRREGCYKGAYILLEESTPLELILMASGSEVAHCMEAAKLLGSGVRVVSMPCMERFLRQSTDYRESILPMSCTKRIAIEAGISSLWWQFVGSNGRVLGIDRFGLSAPGDEVMEALGMTSQRLIDTARQLL